MKIIALKRKLDDPNIMYGEIYLSKSIESQIKILQWVLND